MVFADRPFSMMSARSYCRAACSSVSKMPNDTCGGHLPVPVPTGSILCTFLKAGIHEVKTKLSHCNCLAFSKLVCTSGLSRVGRLATVSRINKPQDSRTFFLPSKEPMRASQRPSCPDTPRNGERPREKALLRRRTYATISSYNTRGTPLFACQNLTLGWPCGPTMHDFSRGCCLPLMLS